MESTQKILKELSDLTRNLDVLAKEIREMNKINSQNQKTVLKSMEDSAKKAEQTSSPSTSKLETGKDKAIDEAVEKSARKAQKKHDGMFSKFLESFKKHSKEGNKVLKEASLKSLKDANETLLKTGSINQAIAAGAAGGVKGGVKGATQLGVNKTVSLIQENKAQLKEKEKVTPAEKEEKKEDKNSPLTKLNPTSTEKETSKPPIPTSKKDENKGFFERLLDKISPNKKEELKSEKKELAISGSTPAVSKSEPPTSTSKRDEKKGFFSSLFERMRKEKTEASPSDSSKMDSQKSAESKSSAESITKPSGLTEGQKIKQDIKTVYKGSLLGKTISGVKSLFTKEKKKEEGKSELKKEEKILKTPPAQTSMAPATSTPEKDKSESSPTSSPSQGDKKESTPQASPTPSVAPTSNASKDSSGSTTPFTADDIKDIKSLLSSINSALKNPLTIKDNKPFRPKSNMLE